jgi:hypothetical protein
MEDNVLTPEQRAALGIDSNVQDMTEVKRKRGPVPGSKRTIVEEQMSPAEAAKAQMMASFGTETEETLLETPSKTISAEIDINELLAGLSIDVSKVKITDKPSVNAVTDRSIVINGRPTFEAVCNQSGYVAYLHSLKYSDLSSLENSVGGFYAGRQRLYKVIYDKLNSTSVGKVDFRTFLEMTSLYDVPSLMYGIYCQTFKTEVEFTVKCPHCERDTMIKVPNKALLSIKNEEVFNNIEEIIGNLSSPDEVKEKSLVNTRTKLVLPTSKMIFELKIPTLYKYLETVGSVKPEKFDELQDILGMMVFIDKVYKLDIAKLVKDKEVVYYEVKEKDEIGKIISELEITDSAAVQKIITAETEKYAIEYTIKGMKCRHEECNKEIGDIPVDMEELTFFRLRQM